MSPHCLTSHCVLPESPEFPIFQCFDGTLKGKHSSKCQVTCNQKKNVTFNNVEIRYYPVIIGDNPSVSDGCPVTIDWEPIGISLASLDEFETFRFKSRRHYSKLLMNEMTRYHLLLDAGYNVFDILDGERSAKLLKSERMFSYYTKVAQCKKNTNEESTTSSRRF
jgi:hypothetical protein